jgi:NDP-sugar pyrophosphorylase family protein
VHSALSTAFVLTAGLGTRLDPLTRLVAKPAVPVGDRSLLEHVLAWLRAKGVTDVLLNLHHRPESITAIVGDGSHLGLRARYSWEDPILGSAGGPRRALQLIDTDPVLIVNGDTICPIDLRPMLEAHVRHHAAVTMAVVPNPAVDHYRGIMLDAGDRITAFVPKGTAGSWHFVGIQLINREVLSGLADGVPAETTTSLYPDLVASGRLRLRGWRVDRPFTDVGTPRDYLDAALAATPSASRSTSVVWPGAGVSKGAHLERCIVAGAVTLPDGFDAHDAVLVPADVLRPGETVRTAGDVAMFPL